MDTFLKDDIELSIAEFRKKEISCRTKSEFSDPFDEVLNNYAKREFAICASMLIKCFRITEIKSYKEDYKIYSPLHHIGPNSVWDQSENSYYRMVAVDIFHDASVIMLLANGPYSPREDVFASEPSLKMTKSIVLNGEKIGPNTPINQILEELSDPLGDDLKAARTTREAVMEVLSSVAGYRGHRSNR